jgi:tetratricopeptide (TPR) repeat protein
VPNEVIQSIRYDGQTANYQMAETRESSGMLAEAAELYKKAATESTTRPLARQSALFHEASVLADIALSEPDRMSDAKAALTKFIKDYPAGRQIIPAREALFRLQLNSGDLTGAEATVADLSRLPKTTERAAVLKTKLLAKQGKFGESIEELDRLIASAPKGSARLRAAQLSKAESLAGLKKFAEAETLAREVILANPAEDAASQAPAYNTLGDCLRAANRPKDALRAYLHTDLLYSKEKVEHPKALYQISALFRQLKQDARADEFAQRLKQEYPRSPWLTAKSSSEQ